MKGLRLIAGATGAVVIAVGLSACAGNASGQASAQAQTTLNISVPTSPNSFQVGAWAGGNAVTYLSLYDTIFMRNGTGPLQPDIAKSWGWSDGGKELTLHIRPGMKFSDNTPVNANAVADSLNFARTGAATASNLSNVTSITAPDSSTVVIKLSAPDASLAPALAGVVGVVASSASLKSENSVLDPVGSGAYVLDTADTIAGSVYVLKKNPNNWNASAYPFNTVKVRIISDPSAVQNALLSGQLDYGDITPSAVSQFSSAKFTTGSEAPTAMGALWLADRNGTIAPALADPRVRQAISLAFNRDQVAQYLDPGTNNATNQVFNPEGQTFDKSLLAGSYDPAKARKLLTEAGYPNGFSVTMPSSAGITTQYEPVITSSLAAIGIKVTWVSVPSADYYAQILTKKYPMFMGLYGFTGSDPQDEKRMTSGIFNPWNLTSPDLTNLLVALGEAPTNEQAAALKPINQFFLDQNWIVPFTYTTGTYVASKAISYTPMTGTANGLRPFAPAGK
jgi:ABC-type transport system substrate-binding protein